MDVIRALVLGIVEGLTEFLPISSTGHLIIVGDLLGVDEHQPPWSALLWFSQLAAIFAVILVFFDDLRRRILGSPRALDRVGGVDAVPHETANAAAVSYAAQQSGDWKNHLLTKLVVAMIPTIVLALLFKKLLDRLESPIPVAIALIVGAGVMEFIDRRFRRTAEMQLDDITLRQAFLIGAIQALSMMPGVSRAGATIMGGMVLGLTPTIATQFSFYLAIPTMLAASVKTLMDHHAELNGEHAAILLVGCGAAFTTAVLVVSGFLGFVRRYRFTSFAVYRVVLGVAVLLWAARGT